MSGTALRGPECEGSDVGSDQIDVSGYDYEATEKYDCEGTENDQVRVNATVRNEIDDHQRVSLRITADDGHERNGGSDDIESGLRG